MVYARLASFGLPVKMKQTFAERFYAIAKSRRSPAPCLFRLVGSDAGKVRVLRLPKLLTRSGEIGSNGVQPHRQLTFFFSI